ncbi:MAG: CoA pyrophosphatase [Deltaproteobacteria bacterium]|nr:CoA pyrophosphatase [Deltaproteobacteria bacterium]
MSALAERLKAALAEAPPSDVPQDDSRPAAVLVPFFKDEGLWQVLFTKRTDKVEQHKGQVSFPGGAQDPEDESLVATSLRETQEEIGVKDSDVELVGRLRPTRTVSNYLVQPFVGIIPYPYPFQLNSFEVDSLVKVPLDQLLTEARGQRPGPGLALNLIFNRQGEVIWGATARILYQLLEAAFL